MRQDNFPKGDFVFFSWDFKEEKRDCLKVFLSTVIHIFLRYKSEHIFSHKVPEILHCLQDKF